MSEFRGEFQWCQLDWGRVNTRLSLQVGCLPRGHRREYHFLRLCAKC